MTKGLLDPPSRATTVSSDFGNCECSHPPLFAVRSGVDFEDALVHLSTLLKGAFATPVPGRNASGRLFLFMSQ